MLSTVLAGALLAAALTQGDAPQMPPPVEDPAVPASTVSAHPFDTSAARFEASDSLLVETWIRAREGLAARAVQGFNGDLRQPAGVYWGDGYALMRAQLWLDGDPALSRALLMNAFHPSPTPIEGHSELAQYSLVWPMMLKTYLAHTGDATTAQALAHAVFPPLFAHFELTERKDGLIQVETPWLTIPALYADRLAPDDDPDAVSNAFYLGALESAAWVLEELGEDSSEYRQRAAQIRGVYAAFWDPAIGLFKDGVHASSHSVLANAIALYFDLVPDAHVDAVLDLIRMKGLDCHPALAPYVIEACFRGGADQLARDLLSFQDNFEWDSSAAYLVPEYIFGLRPMASGWSRVKVAPRIPAKWQHALFATTHTRGRITARYARNVGLKLTVAPGTPVEIFAAEGDTVMVHHAISHMLGTLTQAQQEVLSAHAWDERVGNEPGVWVSVEEQMLRVIEAGEVTFQARCATAEKGVGSEMDSLQTPLGWHSIARKVGDDAPWGQVFQARAATRELWKPGDDVVEDLVLSRILLLSGEEPGLNKGARVDSFARNIYIHGTNDEARLGTPSSHGCIRLSNDDIIEAYRRLTEATWVLITE